MVVISEHLEGSSSSLSTLGYSSSAHGHSSSTHDHKYDLFLSFRGLDTRLSFTNYLYEALTDANLSTFLDDEEIETGEDLKPELESAIKSSRASIIVLSKNYASSTWCLDELVLILEQRMASSHIVIPIFYHVEPTHVRKQQGSFGDAMAKHKQVMEEETNENKRTQWARKMDKWNKALTEVADLKGKNVNGRLETKFIEEILEDIYRRLHVPLRSVRPQLIGMVSSVKFITSWMKDASSHVLSIVGMGGIGKTSLAKYVYRLHCCEFDKSSCIEDIGRKCDEKFNGLIDIQKQLCNDLSKTSSIEIHDVSLYTSKIENVLARKRVFLVLDDITSLVQLDALLGSKGFHPGSKIIITTKDTWLTESCALFKTNIKPKHAKHFLKGLDWTESRQLLCFHAFMSNHPDAGYEDVSHKILKYCQGHPLALEVLGKSLHNRDVAYWEGCMEGLKKGIGSPINNVLRMSFDSLLYNDKELFKYVACFFVGMDKDVAETILKACDINTKSGITNLIDRFLLSIGRNNELKMHQLVQEMGRFEVHQESADKPWKRSRLWCNEDSFRVLKRKMGKENILGLSLDMRMLEKKKLGASSELKTDTLSNMHSLMLLQLNYVHMNGSYENFPYELRALCMCGFRLKSIPSDLPMENLVALDMSYSSIESFISCYNNPKRVEKRQKLDESCLKEKKLFRSLKILNLSFCKQLRSLGDFDQLHALERLILRNCIGLVKVCDTIEECVELVLIDLSYCNKLERLPKIIGMLKKVKTMLLDGCNLGESRIKIRDMDSPEMCKANNIDINTRLSTSVFVGATPCALKFSAISLPSSLVKLSLTNNNLFTESFPMDFSSLSMLTHLYIDGNPINSLPNCVRTLPRLRKLSMKNCRSLKLVEQPPHTLTSLVLEYIEKIVVNPEMSLRSLSSMSLDSPNWSYEIEGMMILQPMVVVEEKVLRSLGWTHLNFFKGIRKTIYSLEWRVQMIYQYGIFSTMYEQEEMPNWFRHRSAGSSISFTIPSSPNNLRGLNLCYVFKIQPPEFERRFKFSVLTLITFNNITKNRMWIYELCTDMYNKDQTYVSLSHWMFGMNEMEMECGDSVTIIVTEGCYEFLTECGVSFVYDDGNTEEEDDALGYYKLRFFQTTGRPNEMRWLKNLQIFLHHYKVFPYYHRIVGDDADYQEQKEPWFKAFPGNTPDIIGHIAEGEEESSRGRWGRWTHIHKLERDAFRKMGNLTTLNQSRETQSVRS